MSLRVRRVERFEDFVRLADLWHQVASVSGQASPFLSHDWFTCCWHAAGPGCRPEILVVEDAGHAVGLAPLMRSTGRVHGLPARVVGFLETVDTPVSDMLIAGSPHSVVEAALDHLRERRDWDVLRFQKLPVGSAVLKALESALAARLRWQPRAPLGSPYLAVGGDWKTFYASTSQRFKKTARNIRNRLERAGRVSIEEHRAVDPEGPLFAEMLELTGRSWKAERRLAIATMPRMREFFGELTRRATANGWLSLWLLRLDGRPIATEYQIVHSTTAHALRADFDLAFRDLSPGSALNYAIAEALFNRSSIHEYNMGPGLNDYKLRWATGLHETGGVTAFHPGPYGRALAAVENALVPAVRRVVRALR
jgi:CelD/BcsL family acetyltransferase involved in cellulose biosynthesis